MSVRYRGSTKMFGDRTRYLSNMPPNLSLSISVRINAKLFPLPLGPMWSEFAGRARKGALGWRTVGPSPDFNALTSGILPLCCRSYIQPGQGYINLMAIRRQCSLVCSGIATTSLVLVATPAVKFRVVADIFRTRVTRESFGHRGGSSHGFLHLRQLFENLHRCVTKFNHRVDRGHLVASGGKVPCRGSEAADIQCDLSNVGYVLPCRGQIT